MKVLKVKVNENFDPLKLGNPRICQDTRREGGREDEEGVEKGSEQGERE